MIKKHLPDRFKGGIEHYLQKGILPGSFLTAVLENNLKMAFAQADAFAIHELGGIVCWLYNEIPSLAWGSEENVKNWVKKGGEEGR